MGVVTANRREHELGKAIQHSLVGHKRKVNPLQAREIANAAMDENGGERIKIDFNMSTKTRTKGCIEYRENWITLYDDGQTVGTLIHELAHQLPDGKNHDHRWRANFVKLAEWWNNNHERFPYNLGAKVSKSLSPFAVKY